MVQNRRTLIALGLAVAAAALYLPDLAGSPFYLNRDEMFFGLTAHSLATTGYDANGHFLPLYTQSPMRYGSEMWFQPALMYSSALSVKLFGLTEGTIRLPMVLFGIAAIVLMYWIGLRLFRRERPAIAAAALLALTPAHYINSRVAMDFQAPLPFLLLWLLCILTYFESRSRGWLIAAGLSLGFGLYTYIAAYMWMPVYGVLTMIALYASREKGSRYVTFFLACAAPALLAIPFLVLHPTVIRDVMWHYDRAQPQTAGGAQLLWTYFGAQRFLNAAAVYWRFWQPRFLFIDGPNGLWSAGVFLLPMSGMLLIGAAGALRRARVEVILILGGLITAAIPASLVGDVDAIHRASAVLPFAVLIAVAGFERIWSGSSVGAKIVAFIVMWSVMIALAAAFHGYFPLAQASIRAATAPLAVAALCAILWTTDRSLLRGPRFWLIAAASVGLMQIAYLIAGFGAVAWASLIALAAAGVATRQLSPGDGRRSALAAVVLSVAISHFMFTHGEYSAFNRIGAIPATAVIMAVRWVYALVALAAFMTIGRLFSSTRDSWRHPASAIAFTIALVAVQLAYFHVTYFDGHLRSVQALAVVAGAALVAALVLRSGSFASALHRLAVAGLLGAVAIQFAYFHADYFSRYRAEAGHFDTEGNQRVVWDAVADEAARRDVPAIYAGSVGPYGFADLYWKFDAIKRGHDELLPRTTTEAVLNFDRVRALPPSSLVVTSPSPEIDAALGRMVEAHEIHPPRLLTAPDGRSKFWLIETGPAANMGRD